MARTTGRLLMAALLLAAVGIRPALAQQTSGNIGGRVLDQQGSAIPGASVTARNPETGFTRSVLSDSEGVYRLSALPIGTYDLTVDLEGFTKVDRKGIIVNVGQTVDVNFDLKVAQLAETVTVSAGSPLVETSSSSVGGVVDVQNIESLPLNGRQFANLALTIPGVGLGFHSDPTKSTQFSPQIGGGNGRNVNYQIDGGDNNDDTVGGLLQLFPLEAIQEFNFQTARYKAEYGRSNGGVMNIVTKSGTNRYHGSGFSLFRDSSMNARTETEKLSDVEKQDYRRYQFGGSFGGPIMLNRAHFFAAAERTQLDTKQAVDTFGLFPSEDGIFTTPVRENLLTIKGTTNIGLSQYLSVRYGRNTNSQPYGAGPQAPVNNWGVSENTFNSINLNHNWVLGGTTLNEFIFQYADFGNAITANSLDPFQIFPNGVTIGQNPNTPQQTQQKKWQFRDDFSWHVAGRGGLGHDFKGGANFINEPTLFITFNVGTGGYAYQHLDNNVNGPISQVTLQGGSAEANIPTKQFAVYFQDDWRVTDKLTLNLGLRYDLNTGFAIDQTKNPNYAMLAEAGRTGLLSGLPGFEDFGKDPKEDHDNIQPRAGFAYDVRGDGRDVIRAGYGRYFDFGYTNSNVLFAAVNATGLGAGTVFEVNSASGIRNPDGTSFSVNDPISNIAPLNEAGGALPLNRHVASPRLKQPYTDQISAGWSHQLGAATVMDLDYVHVEGRDIGWRPRLNAIHPGETARPLALLGIGPSPSDIAIAISRGKSRHDALNVGLRRRMTRGVQLTGWYSLSRSLSTTGNSGDELDLINIQNAADPFNDVQFGPSRRSDARHRATISAIVGLPYGLQVSPIWRYRSALPVNIVEGVDLNLDNVNDDIPAHAYAFDGVGKPAKDTGPCTTVNCGRGAGLSQLNLRVSKGFGLTGGLRVEAIAEVFNLLNAKNPSGFGPSTQFRDPRLLIGADGRTTENPNFLQPVTYAGDFQEPEQRVGQIGFRVVF
jgi:Carboxypeptidase regulatory-like domain/TonB dependent receptor-like, beta-barrel